jgi:predicted GNAT family N-acyltransferase
MNLTFEKRNGMEDMDEIKKLRKEVFMKEDGYPEEALTSEFDKDATHFIAKKDGRFVGAITVVIGKNNKLPIEKYINLDQFRDKPLAELQKLAIISGERKGFIALGIMVLAYEHAKENGAERIVIFSLEKKKDNLALYKKFGFKIIDKFDFYNVGKANALMLDLADTAKYEKNDDQKNRIRMNVLQKLSKSLQI